MIMKQLTIILSALVLAFFMTACQQDALEGIDYLNANEHLEERTLCETPAADDISFGVSSYNLYVYTFGYNGEVHQIRWRVRTNGDLFTNWNVMNSTAGYYETLTALQCSQYEVQLRVACTSGTAKWSAWSDSATVGIGNPNNNSPC